MPADLAPADRAALENIVRQLEAAWNAMDGSAFGAPFAAEADFVNIRGEHFRGQAAIAAGHAAIFQTIYAGSTNPYIVEGARLLRPEVALVRVHSILDAPQGPLAGHHGARLGWATGLMGNRVVRQRVLFSHAHFIRRNTPMGVSPAILGDLMAQ